MSEQFSERQSQQQQDGRPDPETLLKRYNLRDKEGTSDTTSSSASFKKKEEGKRGRLRVYLGSVAG